MSTTSAVDSRDDPGRPLADRMRPRCLADVVGQSHAVGPGTLIRHAIETDRPMIIHTDGEVFSTADLGLRSLVIEVVPAAIQVMGSTAS